MKCSICQTRTIGFVVGRSGGTRIPVLANPRDLRKPPLCKPCAKERIAALDAADRADRRKNNKP